MCPTKPFAESCMSMVAKSYVTIRVFVAKAIGFKQLPQTLASPSPVGLVFFTTDGSSMHFSLISRARNFESEHYLQVLPQKIFLIVN
jgi:hypothetical protein